ncbi:MAG: hypothetical protein ABGY96_19605 [bacterium]|nr:hypothetical protein [Pseudomonadales bacterium]
MKQLVKFSIVSVTLLCLTSCSFFVGQSGFKRRDPPTVSKVDVSKKSCAEIVTQTASPTCSFIGDNDPKNEVCQAPSRPRKVKWIEWNFVAEEGEPDEEFTLIFEDDNTPFANTGLCRISEKKTSFRCKIRENSKSDPLKPVYKYSVFFSDSCELDPRIFIVR